MLVAIEGGATLIAVRCDAACTVIPVVAAATKSHGEGHIAFTVEAPPPSPIAATPRVTPAALPPQLIAFIGEWGIPTTAFVLVLALVVAVGVPALIRRRRRRNG